ncbi:MAG: EFR1 family ferrodoxin [Lachnospiraceae bacterium]|nr:EFR1 family ferrodoxin [Candidatus Colinaster equi]
MVGIYFSGTGNTKHCMELLVSSVDREADCISITDKRVLDIIESNEIIYLGYPTQFSNMPYIIRDFIKKNKNIWKGKKIFCISTMGAFSGDGAGCSARELKKYGAIILGGLHIHMPDAVCDSKLLKKSIVENQKIIKEADEKIYRIANEVKSGKYPQEGVGFWSHMCGLFGQRLWFYNKTTGYTDKIKVSSACSRCGKCISVCPMENLSINGNKVIAGNKCTMCYSCVSQCPNKALTLLGKTVVEQCRYEKYVD